MYTYKLSVYTESWQQDMEIEKIVQSICLTWYIHASCMVFTFDCNLAPNKVLELIPCECLIAVIG